MRLYICTYGILGEKKRGMNGDKKSQGQKVCVHTMGSREDIVFLVYTVFFNYVNVSTVQKVK